MGLESRTRVAHERANMASGGRNLGVDLIIIEVRRVGYLIMRGGTSKEEDARRQFAPALRRKRSQWPARKGRSGSPNEEEKEEKKSRNNCHNIM